MKFLFVQDEHFDSGWCTMYGKSPALHYAKKYTRKLLGKIKRVFGGSDYSSDYSYSSSDDSDSDSDGETMGEKFSNAKENIAEKLRETKESAGLAFVRVKSFFQR